MVRSLQGSHAGVENGGYLLIFHLVIIFENEYKTLLVSETPFFFKSVIQAVSNADVEVLSAKEYEKAEIAHGGVMSGFGLYIYDSITPSALPSDGSVWLINQSGNIPETEFSVRTEVVLEEAVLLEMTKSSSTLAKKLTNGLKGTDLYVYKYMKYGLYGDFTTLYSYEGQPMIFTGENAYGNREVVFAFSLHDSNFALSADFVLLARNLLSFSFPNVVEKVNYDCGERLELNVPPAAEAITITSPSGEMDYPASNVMANEYVFEEIGTYNPLDDPSTIKIDTEKAKKWIANGAQPTDTVKVLLKKVGM